MSTEPRSSVTAARIAVGVGAIALLVYLLTMNRTIGFIDKGELLAAASTLGIPHPTGYPTMMLIGYLFTLILPLRDVLALNIMSALLAAASAWGLTLLLDDLLRRLTTTAIARKPRGQARGKRGRGKGGKPETRQERVTLDPSTRAFLAGAGALGIAFTGIWWGQGNGFEVYSLHALLLPLIILTFLRFVDEGLQPESGRRMTRRGFLFAFLVGLSFTNHLTTILIAPGLLLYYFAMTPVKQGKWWFSRIVALAPGFLAGLLPYIWLPIRASSHPWFNWGDPSTLDAIFNHIRGKQYAVWFGRWQVFGDQTAFFLESLPIQVGVIGLLLAGVGLFLLFIRSRTLGTMILLFVIACVIWSGSYDIQEIGPYYMTAILGIGIMSCIGLLWVFERFGRQGALGAAGAVVVLTLLFNYSASDESGNSYVEDMTRNTLNELPKDAVIYSSLWDFWVAGSFYMQKVEALRPDVIVIDQELMRRLWYLDQLERNYPDLMSAVKPEMERFRVELNKFESDLPYDGGVIDASYYGLINAMIDRHIATRPAYVTFEAPAIIGQRYQRTPHGLALRLMPDSTTYLPQDFPDYVFRPMRGRVDYYTAKTHQIYAEMMFNRAQYERRHGNDTLAVRYLDYALSFDPGYNESSVPSLPLRGEESVKEVIGYFDQLHAARGGGRQ